jgi:hypothetical protein
MGNVTGMQDGHDVAVVGEPRSEDWAARLTSLVATGVALVRDRSVRPAFILATGIVLALSVAGVAVGVLVLIAVGLCRLFDNLVFSGHVWATYFTVGGIFCLAGAFVISLGNKATDVDA